MATEGKYNYQFIGLTVSCIYLMETVCFKLIISMPNISTLYHHYCFTSTGNVIVTIAGIDIYAEDFKRIDNEEWLTCTVCVKYYNIIVDVCNYA